MANNIRQSIGLRVKAARLGKNLSQSKLAERIERTKETVSNIERGITAPTIETLERLSRILDMPVREFFEESADSVTDRKRFELELEIRELVRRLSVEELKIAKKQILALSGAGD